MHEDTREIRLVHALGKALEGGSAHGASLRTRGKLLAFSGAFVALYAMLLYLPGKGLDAYAYVLATALGGYLAGLSAFFSTAGRQWPVLSRFIDRDAVVAAANAISSDKTG